MSTHNQLPPAARLLIGLQALLGLGAVFGGGALMLAPDGSLLGMPLSVMQGAPFADFFIPGLILFAVVGIFPLCVAYSLWKRPAWSWPNAINPFKRTHWAWAGSLAAGVDILTWILVELFWVPFAFIHGIYLGWGVLILLLTLLPVVRRTYTR